ncbi:MAG: TonB-dependent receptor [Pseudomonadota bacterium]
MEEDPCGFSLYVIGEKVDTFNRDTNSVSSPTALGTPDQIAHDPFGTIGHQIPQFFDRTTDRYIGQLDWQFSEQLGLVAVYTSEESGYFRLFGDPSDLSRFPNAGNAEFDANSETTSAEIRLEYTSEKLTGRVGIYQFDEESLNVVTGFVQPSAFVPVDPPDAIAAIIAEFVLISENSAYFGEMRYEPNERWAFEAGVRFDEETNLNPGIQGTAVVDPPTCTIAAFVPGLGGLPCLALLPQQAVDDQLAEFDAWLPRVAATYRFDDDRSLSLAIQRGYRAGGSYLFQDPNEAPGTPPRLESFGPEYVTNYELSFRSLWFEERLLFNANVYRTDWTDQQVLLQGPTGLNDNRTVNVGESELQGFEIESQWFVNDNLEIFTSLGYSKTEFLRFPFSVDDDGNPIIPMWADLSGNEFSQSPNITGSVGAYYRTDNGWFGDVTLSYTDGGYSDVFNLESDKFQSQTLTNLRVGYDADRYRVVLYANNLFDRRALTQVNYQNVLPDEGLVTFDGPVFLGVNKPRIAGLQLEFRL